ncbi:MAG: glycosyltransferase [Ferruginibacter sp.]
MLAFTIIICTHNPNEQLLNRLLTALQQIENPGLIQELIIVDNNSTGSLAELKSVRDFVVSNSRVRIITESKPGLTNARIAGIKLATADWIIFFDDDNEPAVNYLSHSASLVNQYPQVGAWGPGNVSVEFFGKPVENWILNFKHLFQLRYASEIKFSNKKDYQDCYPHGTGLVISKKIAVDYIALYETGALTLSDRVGKSLSSGGDTQMVLLTIKNGLYAGISPHLNINHLIESKKANLTYLKKQVYYTASSYFTAYNEIFPKEQLAGKRAGNLDILKSLYAAYRIHFKADDKPTFNLRLSRILGEYASPYIASTLEKPFIIRIMEKYLING